MEKLSSLTPEGAPAERGRKGFNPYLESENDTTTLSFHSSTVRKFWGNFAAEMHFKMWERKKSTEAVIL